MEPVLLAAEVHLTNDKVTTEKVVEQQRCDVAMSPGGVVRLPAGTIEIVGGTGVGGPTGA